MASSPINLSFFSLVGVIMLVLAGTSFVYLLRVKDKSSSSRMLLWFFLFVMLSAIATILTNSGTAWEWAFAPAQDALLILGGTFLLRFAYLYPVNDQPGESRRVVLAYAAVALAALGYATYFALRYFASLPADLDENQAFYLLTPAAIMFIVLIFFRRAMHSSNPPGDVPRHALLKPGNPSALALRNYGLALSVSLVPAVVTVIKPVFPAVVASFLFNFGIVIAIAALMLVYLNHAPEPTSIYARLVGVSLVSMAFILGLASVLFFFTIPVMQVHDTVVIFIALVVLSSLLIILLIPIFFRTSLLDPLSRLSRGVKAANAGNLDIQVPVQYEDEIGFLTHSFNQLVISLNEATQALKKEAASLEKQVGERTAELHQSNEQLLNEIHERKVALDLLDRQLGYEQALAGCSRSLLALAGGEPDQKKVLNEALEHLRTGAQASRAYVFRNLADPVLGPCMSILAEACAPEIDPHLNNPANQKFPWSRLPEEWFATLGEGRPYGGPVEQVMAGSPDLVAAFLSQRQPLLSVQTFPIAVNEQWWGFVGFDECQSTRIWDEGEILLLGTAAEMIGSTLQRWQAEARLHEILAHLEERVRERTIEYGLANAELKHEIHERQRFQEELEDRLNLESALANISARLLSPMDLEAAIHETLVQLGQIMKADRVIFFQPVDSNRAVTREAVEWHSPDLPPLAGSVVTTQTWVCSLLDGGAALFIKDLSDFPGVQPLVKETLFARGVRTLLLSPLLLDNHLEGVILIGNSGLPGGKITENMQLVEVVAGLLGSLVRREVLLNTLEEKVAERTRELSTFFDMIMVAGEAHEIAEILQPALLKIMEINTSEAALIHLYDEDLGCLKLVAQRGFPIEDLAHLQMLPLDEPLTEWMRDNGSDHESPGLAKMHEAFVFPRFQSSAQVSLRARGKPQGLLSCYRLADIPFNTYQVFFLSAVGEQLGMAVENHRLRLKTEEVATIQERQRLARELHDSVSQSLYSLTLFARAGRDALDSGQLDQLAQSLVEVEDNAVHALREMRLLLYQLRGEAVEQGLSRALTERFQMIEHRLGIRTELAIEGSLPLDQASEQELFWLVSEALNNIVKHASAGQVAVTINNTEVELEISVVDDGVGFDVAHARAGIGLNSMRERAELLGGVLEIHSQPGSGTQVRLVLPVETSILGR